MYHIAFSFFYCYFCFFFCFLQLSADILLFLLAAISSRKMVGKSWILDNWYVLSISGRQHKKIIKKWSKSLFYGRLKMSIVLNTMEQYKIVVLGKKKAFSARRKFFFEILDKFWVRKIILEKIVSKWPREPYFST